MPMIRWGLGLPLELLACLGAIVRTFARLRKQPRDSQNEAHYAPHDNKYKSEQNSTAHWRGKKMGLPVKGIAHHVSDSSCDELAQNGRNDD